MKPVRSPFVWRPSIQAGLFAFAIVPLVASLVACTASTPSEGSAAATANLSDEPSGDVTDAVEGLVVHPIDRPGDLGREQSQAAARASVWAPQAEREGQSGEPQR
jgi:hypothetical protein